MSRPVDTLLDYLRAEEARGTESVYLDEQAKELLRELHRKARAQKNAPAKAAAASPVSMSLKEEPPAQPVPAPVVEIKVSGGTAAEQIESLKKQAQDWAPAKALNSLREAMVFSTGNPEAELMLVGEAPGYQEERQQQPFVGPAGQKLDGILKAMGLERDAVYISNIVKFRPSMPKQTTNNRKPTPEEMASCISFVREEVRIVKPKCIVALGATAAEGLLGLTGAVGKMRTSWHEFEGIPAKVTYHPAYLLHGNAGLKDKRMIWEDMLTVMEKLELPISDKQRGFFLPK
ncbi:uracil-DNA glycosylase [Haloferula sp.]|uniref:uracil-DNA glycosylase n=1 Tax=Haloferula sp. TaxID=2497595 RepID=UPI00329F164C